MCLPASQANAGAALEGWNTPPQRALGAHCTTTLPTDSDAVRELAISWLTSEFGTTSCFSPAAHAAAPAAAPPAAPRACYACASIAAADVSCCAPPTHDRSGASAYSLAAADIDLWTSDGKSAASTEAVRWGGNTVKASPQAVDRLREQLEATLPEAPTPQARSGLTPHTPKSIQSEAGAHQHRGPIGMRV